MATYGIQLFAADGTVITDSSNLGLAWLVGQGASITISYGAEPNRLSQVEFLLHNMPVISPAPDRYYTRNARTLENDVFLSLHPNEKNHPNHWESPNGIDKWVFKLDVTYAGRHITKATVDKGALTAIGLNNNRI